MRPTVASIPFGDGGGYPDSVYAPAGGRMQCAPTRRFARPILIRQGCMPYAPTIFHSPLALSVPRAGCAGSAW